MKDLGEPFFELDRKIKTEAKLEILKSHFAAKAGIPAWLFEACHGVTGNLYETITLLIPELKPAIGENRLAWANYLAALEKFPFTISGVLIAAQMSRGRRTELFTDYTFAVWHNQKLVPVVKAYSGLADSEIREIDAFVRNQTLKKSGPVHHVTPALVFEIAFEDIAPSKRRPSGVAMRFPKILRWRPDKTPHEAGTLDGLLALLENSEIINPCSSGLTNPSGLSDKFPT